MFYLLAVKTQAEAPIWHHPSRRPVCLLVAIRLHRIPYVFERTIFYPYQNWYVFCNFAFPAFASHRVTDLLINTKGTYFIAEEYGSGGTAMVSMGPTTWYPLVLQHSEDASLIGFLKAQLRHQLGNYILWGMRCNSSGCGIDFKPIVAIYYCVSEG